MDKFEVVQGSTLTQFMSEMKNMQEKNFTSLQREIEKVKEEIEKMDLKFTSKFDQVRRLEAQGVPTNQAEAITSNITEVANNGLEHVTNFFASKSGMHKFEVVQGSTLTQFISEMKNMQEKNFTALQREIQKFKEEITSKLDLGKEEIKKMDLKLTSKLDLVKEEIEKMDLKVTSKLDLVKEEIEKMDLKFTSKLDLVKEEIEKMNLKFTSKLDQRYGGKRNSGNASRSSD